MIEEGSHRTRKSTSKAFNQCPSWIPRSILGGLDTWEYSSFEDSIYGTNLDTIYVTAWRGVAGVFEYALIFVLPILSPDFRA